jgi:hypothetical protein
MQFTPLTKKGPPYESLLIEADTIEAAAEEAKRQYPQHVKETGNPFGTHNEPVDFILLMPRPVDEEAQADANFFDFMMNNRPQIFDFETLVAR